MNETISYGKEGGVLTLIREGMTVYDADAKEIGEVESVYFGSDSDIEEGRTPTMGEVSDPRDLQRNQSWLTRLVDALDLDAGVDMPEELAERLLKKGFIRIESDKVLEADRFVVPEQIESVSEEGVWLNIYEDELVKRP